MQKEQIYISFMSEKIKVIDLFKACADINLVRKFIALIVDFNSFTKLTSIEVTKRGYLKIVINNATNKKTVMYNVSIMYQENRMLKMVPTVIRLKIVYGKQSAETIPLFYIDPPYLPNDIHLEKLTMTDVYEDKKSGLGTVRDLSTALLLRNDSNYIFTAGSEYGLWSLYPDFKDDHVVIKPIKQGYKPAINDNDVTALIERLLKEKTRFLITEYSSASLSELRAIASVFSYDPNAPENKHKITKEEVTLMKQTFDIDIKEDTGMVEEPKIVRPLYEPYSGFEHDDMCNPTKNPELRRNLDLVKERLRKEREQEAEREAKRKAREEARREAERIAKEQEEEKKRLEKMEIIRDDSKFNDVPPIDNGIDNGIDNAIDNNEITAQPCFVNDDSHTMNNIGDDVRICECIDVDSRQSEQSRERETVIKPRRTYKKRTQKKRIDRTQPVTSQGGMIPPLPQVPMNIPNMVNMPMNIPVNIPPGTYNPYQVVYMNQPNTYNTFQVVDANSITQHNPVMGFNLQQAYDPNSAMITQGNENTGIDSTRTANVLNRMNEIRNSIARHNANVNPNTQYNTGYPFIDVDELEGN